MISRLASAALGVLLLTGVVLLGVQATRDDGSVIWFGIAAAIAAPIGIAALGYTLRGSNRQLLHELSKVPDIERLIHQAKSYEEKVALLEEERGRLVEAVQTEARREALLQRKDYLEQEGRRILDELAAVDAELVGVEQEARESEATAEISELYDRLRRVRRGDLVLRVGSRYVIINRDLLLTLPMGRVVWWYMRIVSRLLQSSPTSRKIRGV